MPTLTATVRKAAEQSTLDLPFAIPAKDWFSLAETATLCGMSESYVEKKFDEGKDLSGHEHNGGTGARTTKRVPRVWLLAFMIKTARYDDAAIADAFVACLRWFPVGTLERIAREASARAAAKKFSPVSSVKLSRSASGN